MDELIDIKVSVDLLSMLIAGVYCTSAGVDPVAIPPSLYMELTEVLIPYLKVWDYEKFSFEDWIRDCLIIAPKELFGESELEDAKSNTIYIERSLGNVILIATGDLNL